MPLPKYSSTDIEHKYYPLWEQSGYFQPNWVSHGHHGAFAIQLPPPNITGTLHMGHAFNQTIMDSLTRYYRMNGATTCWIPGSDHAGIATQIVVERQLATQNISRHDLGRDAFLDKVWQWKEKSGGTITQQMRRLGCSVDWTQEYFTMDETRANIVTKVFVKLYQQGLIYRGKRLVNWDPVLGTAVSDLEVENIETDSFMWHIRYPFADNPSESLTVATTRPETLLGDVAVAVNPNDERYQHLIGKHVILPLTNRTIPIIADEYVEKDFGTGCVKITPAHDFNDYEVGKRHDTTLINVFNLEAKVLSEAQVFDYRGAIQQSFSLPDQYVGLERFDARKQIIADLENQGYLIETKPHKLMTPKGDRTGSVIEPLLTDQWFVDMNAIPNGGEPDSEFKGMSLAQKAKQAVENGTIQFVPENWINTYNQWMNNLQDWCISRQLWWGHQIPAWYDENGNVYVAETEEEAQKLSGSLKLTRDEDVLDTWFSSALVPFSTLGWNDNGIDTDELKAFLPSSVVVTGHEIIFFWVARMIMMTTHFTGKVPFKDVYIHGIVCDHEGKKMSKSEGNVIDPVDLIDGIALPDLLEKRTTGLRRPETAPQVRVDTEKLFPDGIPAMGADALRLAMASYATLGRSVHFDFKRAESKRNFCNKLWNATNFVLMNVGEEPIAYCAPFTFVDQWIVSRLQEVIVAVREAFESYRLDRVTQLLHDFVWNDFCDWYLELAKVQLKMNDGTIEHSTQYTLLMVLETILRLMHPIAPFITEELWQCVAPLVQRKYTDSIMMASFPVVNENHINPDAVESMTVLQNFIGAIRNLRGEMNIAPNVKVPLLIEGNHDWYKLSISDYTIALEKLTMTTVHIVDVLPSDDAPISTLHGTRMMLKVEVNVELETNRLNKEVEKVQNALDKLNAKLNKAGYIEKAPQHLVEKDKAELADWQNKMTQLQMALNKLNGL